MRCLLNVPILAALPNIAFYIQGEVFIFAAKRTLESRPDKNANSAGVAHGLEYIWLCNECRRRFIVDYNQTWGLPVSQKREEVSGCLKSARTGIATSSASTTATRAL